MRRKHHSGGWLDQVGQVLVQKVRGGFEELVVDERVFGEVQVELFGDAELGAFGEVELKNLLVFFFLDFIEVVRRVVEVVSMSRSYL